MASQTLFIHNKRQLLTTMRLANGLKLAPGNTLSLFDDREKIQFFKPLDRNHQEGITSLRVVERRQLYFSETIESICVQRSKSKLSESEVVVYYNELRKLSAEFEMDGELQVDIPFIVTCVRYGTESCAEDVHVQDKEYLCNQLCLVLANATRTLVASLEGERAATFLSDLAPFNINAWLNNDNDMTLAEKPSVGRLLRVTEYIQSKDAQCETMDESLAAIKRALSNGS